MFRRLIPLLRSPWAAALALLAAAVIAFAAPRIQPAAAPGPAPEFAVNVLDDVAAETWTLAPLPHPGPAPAPEPEEEPEPDPVDWSGLSADVAAVSLDPAHPAAEPAGPTVQLTAREVRSLLEEAEDRASGAGFPRGVGVVIGRGTPGGGSTDGCKLRR